jgi:hypothetical protein
MADALALAAAATRASPQAVAAQGPALDRIRGYALAQQGQPDQARALFEANLQTARSRAARYEEALSLDALICFDGHLGRPAKAGHAVARAALFDQLGLVVMPVFSFSAAS